MLRTQVILSAVPRGSDFLRIPDISKVSDKYRPVKGRNIQIRAESGTSNKRETARKCRIARRLLQCKTAIFGKSRAFPLAYRIDRWCWREKKLKGRPLGERRLGEYSSERFSRIPAISREFFRSRPRENSLCVRATDAFPAARKRPTRLFARLVAAAGSVGYFTEQRLARAVKRRDYKGRLTCDLSAGLKPQQRPIVPLQLN